MGGAYLGLSVVANPRSKDQQCHVTETRPTGGRGVAKKKEDFAEGELHAFPSPFAIASPLQDFLFLDPLGETAVGREGASLIKPPPTPWSHSAIEASLIYQPFPALVRRRHEISHFLTPW